MFNVWNTAMGMFDGASIPFLSESRWQSNIVLNQTSAHPIGSSIYAARRKPISLLEQKSIYLIKTNVMLITLAHNACELSF